MPFITFKMSFMPSEFDREFNIIDGGLTQNTVCLNGESVSYTLSGDGSFENGGFNCVGEITLAFEETESKWFNYWFYPVHLLMLYLFIRI